MLNQAIIDNFISSENELLVDDNSEYRMVIDKSTIKPVTLTLENGEKKAVVEGVVYVFYTKPYQPYSLLHEVKPYSINKYFTYISLEDNTSASTNFSFYNEKLELVDSDNRTLKPTDFTEKRPNSIGDIQFKILKENAQN